MNYRLDRGRDDIETVTKEAEISSIYVKSLKPYYQSRDNKIL